MPYGAIMATKFQEFLQTKKIDPRRVLAASEKLEKLRPEDRAIRLAQRKARRSEDKKKEGLATQKPRSGRPVTDRAISAALTGKSLEGPTRTRLLRAVNQILEQKKQEPVQLSALFDLPTKGGAKTDGADA
jgi:hypothetical protein